MDVFRIYEKAEKIYLSAKENGKLTDKERTQLGIIYDKFNDNYSAFKDECIEDDIDYMISFCCSLW